MTTEPTLSLDVAAALRWDVLVVGAGGTLVAAYSATLGNGFTVKAGRFLSGIGYLNEQHQHVWDFFDAPLPYQAFLGGQFKSDGLQLKWVAPTDTFLEFGGEIGDGSSFPGTDRNKNGIGSGAGAFLSRRVARPLIWDKHPVQPKVKMPSHEILSGVTASLPPITGYVMTTKKEGGPLIETLVDLGADWAMVRKLGRGVPTIDMRVDYHAVALPGDLTIKGKVVRMGGQFSTAEASIFDAQPGLSTISVSR